ncbi:hypothetical protein EDD94_5568 [Streptomyces sp. PanSC9]|nr:hypothetical protein EDD94_5568 [Streptomyces sp. PanSC9]
MKPPLGVSGLPTGLLKALWSRTSATVRTCRTWSPPTLRSAPSKPPPRLRLRRAYFDHMVRLGWVRSPQSIEARSGTTRAGAVDVALYTTASVDAVVPAHPEVNWGQLRAVEKGRHSPLA